MNVANAASAPGSATLVYRYWRAVDGVFVEDVARQRLTAVLPPLGFNASHFSTHSRKDKITNPEPPCVLVVDD